MSRQTPTLVFVFYKSSTYTVLIRPPTHIVQGITFFADYIKKHRNRNWSTPKNLDFFELQFLFMVYENDKGNAFLPQTQMC